MEINRMVDNLLKKLFPVCRSITGNGTEQTLRYIREIIPELSLKKVPSGAKIFDWTVPPEWNIRDAYVKNVRGEKIIDFQKNNLHVVNYSIPYAGTVSEEELLQHLHTLPQKPSWIPYRTSYYQRDWGFCCEHNLITSDNFAGPFEVFIDSELNEDGYLVYGEALKRGKSDEEIIISTYCCHPSLANDNLSGIVTAVLLFKYILSINTRYSYRLAIVPETIGALCFLKNHSQIENVIAGTIITTTAGPGEYSIKEAFDKNHWINKISHLVLLEATDGDYITYPFIPEGSDERQYSSPHFRIPTPSIHKSKYYEYEEYHTSADNLDFISVEALAKTLHIYCNWVDIVDSRCYPVRKEMAGEFQLGIRGLYPNLGGTLNQSVHVENEDGTENRRFDVDDHIQVRGHHIDCFYWLMHLCDGNHSNFDIAERSGMPLSIVNESIILFIQRGLVTI